MRFIAVLLSGFLGYAAGIQLPHVRSVYLFPMANSFDQFLANRLTNAGLFQVVTDPKKADAVFSDRVGPALQSQLDELYPPPAPPASKPAAKEQAGEAAETPAEEAKDKPDKEDKPEKPDKTKETNSPPVSVFSRGKGNIFLVDAHTRAVLWSVYQKPRNATSEELDRAAIQVVTRLKHDLAKPAAPKP